MIIIAYISWLVCIIGLVLFLVSAPGSPAQKVGWEMFRDGLIFALFCACGSHITLGTAVR